MGMFDNVHCHYPLPWPEVQDATWQSKDTPAQYLDEYEIREDGTLWHEAYTSRWEKDDSAPLGFYLYRDDVHWAQVSDVSGELEIHHLAENTSSPGGRMYSIRFWFWGGKVKDMIPTQGA